MKILHDRVVFIQECNIGSPSNVIHHINSLMKTTWSYQLMHKRHLIKSTSSFSAINEIPKK